ncbi:MAG: hypothetical protein ACR2NR_13565 [Solirubrobacteraceae bacterium]
MRLLLVGFEIAVATYAVYAVICHIGVAIANHLDDQRLEREGVAWSVERIQQLQEERYARLPWWLKIAGCS